MARTYGNSKLSAHNSNGNLYYVRLKTDCGVFYKLGFTTFQSVEDRLGYAGSNDAQYIDKVLLFLSLNDAFEIEQELHSCLDGKKAFGKYSAVDEFPLSKNGQTELYIEDVLELDHDYTSKQSKTTTQKLKNKRLLIARKTQLQDKIENIFVAVVGRILLVLLAPLAVVVIILFAKLEGENVKNELLGFLDRMTGGRKQAAREEAELKGKLGVILSRISYEQNR